MTPQTGLANTEHAPKDKLLPNPKARLKDQFPEAAKHLSPRTGIGVLGWGHRNNLALMCGCRRMGLCRGPVAQRLEQATHNRLVPGSNPGGPTNLASSPNKWFRDVCNGATLGVLSR